MEKIIEKANILIEALPYIKTFNGKIVVIKYGGSAMVDEDIKMSVIEDIVLMKLVGLKPVVVHGGGKEISRMLDQLKMESSFHQGLRVTDADTVDVVEMVLSGKVNKSIVQLIQNHDLSAVGISGKDAGTLTVKKVQSDIDIGYVGEVSQVDTTLLTALLEKDFIPVLAPLGTDALGQTYNINADYAAAEVAGALGAEKLIFLTDVEGVLKDVKDPTSLISKITIDQVDGYKEKGIIAGGMIPKVDCCVTGINHGVQNVHILDGRVSHSMLLEIFTNQGVGTMISRQFD